MTNAKKSNIIYSVFLAVLIPLLIMFVAFSGSANRENFTLDYNIVFEIGSYNVKVADCRYDEKEETISFVFKYKLKEEVVEANNSEPVVDSIIYHYEKNSDELVFSTEKISKDETKVICTGVPKKMWYITVNLYSKDYDYTDPDTVDEFGDTIKGETHKGKEHRYYLQIDSRDMNKEDDRSDNSGVSSSSDSSDIKSSVTISETYSVTTTTSETSKTGTENTGNSSLSTTRTSTTAAQKSTAENSTNSNYTSAKPQSKQTNKRSETAVKKTSKATAKATTASTIKAEALSLKTGYASNNVTLKVGQSAKVEPIITPSSAASIDFIWSSSKTSVATVDGNGNIKAITPGKAIIVVKTKTGSLTAACMVTVS